MWAPIMGVGYYQGLVQWSKGEYPGAGYMVPFGKAAVIASSTTSTSERTMSRTTSPG